MAILHPPTMALSKDGWNKWHLRKEPKEDYCLLACGCLFPSNLTSVYKSVAAIQSKDLCQACLGAMTATDPEPVPAPYCTPTRPAGSR